MKALPSEIFLLPRDGKYYLLQEVIAVSEYEGGTFRCKICGKEFLTKFEGDSHYKEEHDEDHADVGE